MKVSVAQKDQPLASGICDEYFLTDIRSMSELFSYMDEVEKNNQGCKILVTLDDINQAEYTSFHSVEKYHLDDVDGHDLKKVSSEAFEDGEHIGYLSTKSEFFIREQNFTSKIKSFAIDDLYQAVSLSKDEMHILKKAHLNPMGYIDPTILLKVVPVDTAEMCLSAFPNGYFVGDMTPFESYALSKYLRERYDYELFGVGASLLGYRRKTELSNDDITSISEDLVKIYGLHQSQDYLNYFRKIIKKSKFLFLKYTEEIHNIYI